MKIGGIMKCLICLVIGICLSIGIFTYITKDKLHTSVTDKINKSFLEELQSKLFKYEQQDICNKQKQIELERLQDPNIITNELKKKGNLIVYEGNVEYKDIISERSFWGSKNLVLNLQYRFGISYNLNNIEVINFFEKNVIIKILQNNLALEYLELRNESQINGHKSFLVSNFKPEEVNMILKNAYDKTNLDIKQNREIFNQAYESLKESLTPLIQKLGYEDVIYNN